MILHPHRLKGGPPALLTYNSMYWNPPRALCMLTVCTGTPTPGPCYQYILEGLDRLVSPREPGNNPQSVVKITSGPHHEEWRFLSPPSPVSSVYSAALYIICTARYMSPLHPASSFLTFLLLFFFYNYEWLKYFCIKSVFFFYMVFRKIKGGFE